MRYRAVFLFFLVFAAVLLCACSGGRSVGLDYQKEDRDYSGRLTVRENGAAFYVTLSVTRNGERKELTFSEPLSMRGYTYVKDGDSLSLSCGGKELPLDSSSTAASLFALFEYAKEDISGVRSGADGGAESGKKSVKNDQDKFCTVLLSDGAEITLRAGDDLPVMMKNDRIIFEIGGS